MSLFSSSFGRGSLAPLVFVLAMGSAPPTADARADLRTEPADNVRISDPTTAWALRRALKGASRYLEAPECQRVFSEFSDAAGHPLQEALDAQARRGAALLGS